MGNPTYDSEWFEQTIRFRANAERFSNYKAWRATQLLNHLDKNDTDYNGKVKNLINIFNRFQVTEYNTFVARARTARQWSQFKDTRKLYPNIQWLPSRSAHPRDEHKAFYYRIWSMDDPFWQQNQPGNLWNCKCDWRQTDTPITDNSEIEEVKSVPGLDKNPATSGQLITDTHPYIAKAGEKIEKVVQREIRSYNREKAFSTLVGKTVKQSIEENGKEKSIKIQITKKGIKHFTGDYYPDPVLKYAMLPYLDQLISEAQYVTSADNYTVEDKITKKFHYFENEMFGRKIYINISEDVKGIYRLYALKDRLKK